MTPGVVDDIGGEVDPEVDRQREINRLAAKYSLDSFQQKYTSQDNASFSTIMEAETEVIKKKNWWREGDPDKQLLLDASQERLAVTWKPDHNNSLMFPPKVWQPLMQAEQISPFLNKKSLENQLYSNTITRASKELGYLPHLEHLRVN